MELSLTRFRELVVEALDDLPEGFRQHLSNVEVVVEERPPLDIARRFAGLLLGLYQGTPLPRRSFMAVAMPDKISIYKGNIERICSSEEAIRTQVRDTVIHEIGHHFGLTEEELKDV